MCCVIRMEKCSHHKPCIREKKPLLANEWFCIVVVHTVQFVECWEKHSFLWLAYISNSCCRNAVEFVMWYVFHLELNFICLEENYFWWLIPFVIIQNCLIQEVLVVIPRLKARFGIIRFSIVICYLPFPEQYFYAVKIYGTYMSNEIVEP